MRRIIRGAEGPSLVWIWLGSAFAGPMSNRRAGENDLRRARRRESLAGSAAEPGAAGQGFLMQHAREPWRLSFGAFLALFAVLTLLSAVPLLLTPLPPLLDYPNHLARMHLLTSPPALPLRQFLVVAWAPLPNLAMDGVVPFLADAMPLAWAGKLFILLTFVLLAGGTAAIHRVLFRRWSAWSCLAFLLLYTRLLLWGFTGYLFGCGLALCGFAAWLALRPRHWLVRLLAGCVIATAVYFAHLLAFGVYAVMIASFEWGEIWRLRPRLGGAARALAIGGLPFLPALVLMAQDSAPGRIAFGNPLRKFDLLFSVFDNYSRPFDVACFVLAVLAFALAFQRRWVKLAPEMAGPLIGLTILYLALPTQLFTASGADRRIPMMIFLALIAGSCWAEPRPALRRWFLGGAGVLFVVRLAVIAAVWQAGGKLYERLIPGLDVVPRGGCLASSFDPRGIEVQKIPLTHFATLAVARRDAFVTTIFAYPFQQPIALTRRARRLAALLGFGTLWQAFVDGTRPLPPAAATALAQCGYVAFAGSRPFSLAN